MYGLSKMYSKVGSYRFAADKGLQKCHGWTLDQFYTGLVLKVSHAWSWPAVRGKPYRETSAETVATQATTSATKSPVPNFGILKLNFLIEVLISMISWNHEIMTSSVHSGFTWLLWLKEWESPKTAAYPLTRTTSMPYTKWETPVRDSVTTANVWSFILTTLFLSNG